MDIIQSESHYQTNEKFSWATHVSLQSPFLVSIGKGYLAMNPDKDPKAIGSPRDIQSGRIPGVLLSAATLLGIHDAKESRWVFLERDSGAPSYPKMWQFPSGRLSPNELPLQCAMRELVEEVRLTCGGLHMPCSDVLYPVDGNEFNWIEHDATHMNLRARHVYFDNTVEFYYHATLAVQDVSDIRVFDNEPYGRVMKLLKKNEIDLLISSDKVCPASALQWAAMWSENK